MLSRASSRYKAAGANAVDETGALDTVEFINVSKDDALAYPRPVHRTYPSTVNARMESTIKPFIEKSVEVNMTLMAVFNGKLGLPEGTLAGLHKMYDLSCSESRCIKNPPARDVSPERMAIGAHTDFGSLVRGGLHEHEKYPHSLFFPVFPSQQTWRTAGLSTWHRPMVLYQGVHRFSERGFP